MRKNREDRLADSQLQDKFYQCCYYGVFCLWWRLEKVEVEVETAVTDSNGHTQTVFSKEEDEEVMLVWVWDNDTKQKAIRELALAVHDPASDESKEDQNILTYYR